MGRHWLSTDGPFPDDTLFTVRFSPSGSGGRTTWPERAGTVVGRVEEDEWEVAVGDPRATEKRGSEEWSPYVYRSRDEMRVLTMSESDEMMAEADHEIAGQKARRWRQEDDEFDQAVERAKNAGASRDQILEAIDAGLDLDDYTNALDDGADHADVIAAKVELALDPSDYSYQFRTGMTVREIMELEGQAKTDRETGPVYVTADSGERNTDRGLQAATATENQRLR